MEIKAKDFRIGNFVNWKGCTSEIKEIFLNSNEYIFGLKYEMPNNQFDNKTTLDIQPIPLTEEWLLKFGIDHNKTIEKKGGNIEIELKSGHVVVLGSDSCTVGMCYFVECKFVHQLQNLYFCLTGEELTI